jgi:hypothetical protein
MNSAILYLLCLPVGKAEECALSEAKSRPRGSPSLPRVRGPANGGTASPSVAFRSATKIPLSGGYGASSTLTQLGSYVFDNEFNRAHVLAQR